MNDCTFLIVDDSEIDQTVTKLLLSRKLGVANIECVSNGAEAMGWLQANQNRIETCLVIILDIRMPVMDGFEFLDVYPTLSLSLRNKISIIMLSSSLDPNDTLKASKNMAVKKLLSKPLSVQELINSFV